MIKLGGDGTHKVCKRPILRGVCLVGAGETFFDWRRGGLNLEFDAATLSITLNAPNCSIQVIRLNSLFLEAEPDN